MPHQNLQPEPKDHPIEANTLSSAVSPVRAAARDFKPVLAARLQILKEIEPLVSAKFYEQLQGKLRNEEAMAATLTSTAFNRHEEKQKYTHILDSHYFEQRFL